MSRLRRIIEKIQKNPQEPFGASPTPFTVTDLFRLRENMRNDMKAEEAMMSKADYLEKHRPKPTEK